MKNTDKKKYSSKYHLKKEIEIIIEKLYDLKRTFQLYRNLRSEGNKQIICDNFPHMFSIIIQSMEEKVLLGLYKVVFDKDKNDRNICITDIIESYNNCKKNFTEKKYYYIKDINSSKRIRRYLNPIEIELCINKIKNDLFNVKGLKEFLRNYRSKRLAHLDKKYSFNSKIRYSKESITYEKIEKFIDLLIDDMNSLYNSIFGISYAFLYNELDELEYLNKIITEKINKKVLLM